MGTVEVTCTDPVKLFSPSRGPMFAWPCWFGGSTTLIVPSVAPPALSALIVMVADVDEGFVSANSVTDKYHHVTYLFGPQVYPLGHHRITPFAHALFGGSYFDFPTDDFSDSAFAFAIGGGVDFNLTHHISIRPVQFDYEQDRNFGGGTTGNPLQNNFKYKGGVIFRF